jgi:hypothetical protein
MFGLVALACGGDGGDSELEDYFRAVEEVNLEQRLTSAPVEGPGVSGNLAFFNGKIPAEKVALDSLRGLVPPDAVGELHGDYLAARAHYLDIGQQIRTRLEKADINFDMSELQDDPVLGLAAYDGAGADVGAACRRMAAVAASNGIDIDFCISGIGEETESLAAVTVGPETCDQTSRKEFPTRTFTVFENAGDSPIRVLNHRDVMLRELGPGEQFRGNSAVRRFFRAEDADGNCVGTFEAQFPAVRVILNSP